MKKTLALMCGLGLAFASSSFAGNIFLTGHDDDFHDAKDGSGGGRGGPGGSGGLQLGAAIAFVRSGSTNSLLPVLTFDQGSELTSALTGLGISFVNIDPSAGAIAASVFDPTVYSAFIVASDSTCGGCDNTPAGEANIGADAAAIAAFLNAGGGIVGLAGARNAATYYNFLPTSASGFGSPPASGYVQTVAGMTLGIPAVNGDPTHNFFSEPGTGGVSTGYVVVERLGDSVTGTAESLTCNGCTVGGGIISGSPEPGTFLLLVGGIGALVSLKRRFA